MKAYRCDDWRRLPGAKVEIHRNGHLVRDEEKSATTRVSFTRNAPAHPSSPGIARVRGPAGRNGEDWFRGGPLDAADQVRRHVIVDLLVTHGVKRTCVVPSESFLVVLDGLHGSPIDTTACRREGGATYMAEADGKMNQVTFAHRDREAFQEFGIKADPSLRGRSGPVS